MADLTQPTESQDSILSQLHELFAGAQNSRALSPDFSSVFQPALDAVNEIPKPTPEAVPGVASPLAGMAAIFAASLANQTGTPGALAATQETLAAQKEKAAAAEHANHARQEAYDNNKALERIGILLKLGEAKAKALEGQRDLVAYETQVKSNFMLAERARKMEEEAKAKAAEREHQYKMEEIMAAKSATASEKADKASAEEDKTLLKFQEDLSNIAKKPGSTIKNPPSMGENIKGFFSGQVPVPTTSLTPSAIAQMQNRAAALARSAKSQRLREVGLSTYIDTLRSPATGKVDTSTPAYARFFAVLKVAIPSAQERNDFLDSLSIQ